VPATDDHAGFDDALDAGEHNGDNTGSLLLPRGALSGEAIPIHDDSPGGYAVR
jgi:hypothetical protein